MLNVLAPTGTLYHGRSLVEAMQSQSLKYGDMNIFHRVDQKTKSKLFSVANALEPGTFDLSDLDDFQSSGLTFFMQLHNFFAMTFRALFLVVFFDEGFIL